MGTERLATIETSVGHRPHATTEAPGDGGLLRRSIGPGSFTRQRGSSGPKVDTTDRRGRMRATFDVSSRTAVRRSQGGSRGLQGARNLRARPDGASATRTSVLLTSAFGIRSVPFRVT